MVMALNDNLIVQILYMEVLTDVWLVFLFFFAVDQVDLINGRLYNRLQHITFCGRFVR